MFPERVMRRGCRSDDFQLRRGVSEMSAVSYILSLIARAQARFCAWSIIGLGVTMTVIILIQIFFRFIVYQPVPWSEEAARYLMVWMGMIGSVLALRKGRHIGVSALVDMLPPGGAAAVRLIVSLTMIVFLGIITGEGFRLALFNAPQLSAAMEISMSLPYFAIPVGAGMMLVDLAADLLDGFFPTRAGVRFSRAKSDSIKTPEFN
jgi:C4-dicarboxylate transporter, DctQ subunit